MALVVMAVELVELVEIVIQLMLVHRRLSTLTEMLHPLVAVAVVVVQVLLMVAAAVVLKTYPYSQIFQ